MLWGPMFFMMAVTFTAIVLKIKELVTSLFWEFDSGSAIQLVFAILLLVLGVMVAAEGLQKLFCPHFRRSDETETEDSAK